MSELETDFLVIGSGVAGLRAAIELAPLGNVLVVTKDVPTESSTAYAQGGVAVVLSDEDEVGIHFVDTIKAGDGLCRDDAVRVLVEEGPERILELIEWGAEFDREGPKLSFTREAAHSRRRILHAQGDSTGKEIERVLISTVKRLPSVQKFPFAMAMDLIIREGRCLGATVLQEGKSVAIRAGATILATGGAGQVFSRTTNPDVATGDGIAMAFRAGAVLEDMEFVQFHPTALFAPSAPQFLLSEAMRGEGALLRNVEGETFMERYHPDAELAPRDVVSRAIVSEMVRTGSTHVNLDLRHLDPGFVKRRFPRIYATCLMYDVTITRDLIPVTPAAHYMMGGVKTDLNGQTTLSGLYAAGEVACTGVHGANRLASNSLLEGLVFGSRAGWAAGRGAAAQAHAALKPEEASRRGPGAGRTGHDVDLEEMRTSLRRLMWERVGIIRCDESLAEARDRLSQWEHAIWAEGRTRRALESVNMLTVACAVTYAALERKGSIGAHYRSDAPERGEAWQRHVTVKKDDGGFSLRASR